jgi:hypothetical protein
MSTETKQRFTSGMAKAIQVIATLSKNQRIYRQSGGFWTIPGFTREEWYIGTPTVRALAKRGLLTPTKFAESHGRQFVIEYEVTR